MKTTLKTIAWPLLAMALCVSCATTPGSKPSGTTLLVMPSRHTVVQFCFDIARIRSVYMVAYDQPALSKRPMLYAWNNDRADWVAIQAGELASGQLFSVPPARTVVIGGAAIMPKEVADAVASIEVAATVESLNVADMANTLDQVLNFSTSEWSWLGDRFGLELKDQNEDLRHTGRYSQNRGQVQPRADSGELVAMPPASVEELEMLGPETAPVSMESAPVPEVSRQTLVIPMGQADAAPVVVAEVPVAASAPVAAAEPMRPEDK